MVRRTPESVESVNTSDESDRPSGALLAGSAFLALIVVALLRYGLRRRRPAR
jgi:hypothetical protein